MTDLETKLQECKNARLRLIATDGIFSMDGTVAPLSKIIELAKKYDAITFVDDCHATGFFGKTGRYIYKISQTSIDVIPRFNFIQFHFNSEVQKNILIIWETLTSLTLH